MARRRGPLTGAERQAAYRARLRSGEAADNPRGKERLDVVTTIRGCAILKRIARHRDLSPGDVLDSVLRDAEAGIVDNLTAEQLRAYYGTVVTG